MNVFLIVNPKGGVGKSTLATNLAGYLAHRGLQDHRTKVMLGDVDRQQSARTWLDFRPQGLPSIYSWELKAGRPARPPRGTTDAVIDTPAGLRGDKLKELFKISNKVLIPLQPSLFDIMATQQFLAEIAELRERKGLQVGIVGMRVDFRTRAAEQLHRFVDSLDLPIIAWLRDTQHYVQLAAHGLTIYDIAMSKVEKDRAQWTPIEYWVEE